MLIACKGEDSPAAVKTLSGEWEVKFKGPVVGEACMDDLSRQEAE